MKNKIITIFIGSILLSALAFQTKANKPPVRKNVPTVKEYSVVDLKKNLEYDFRKSTIRNAYDERLNQLAKLVTGKNYAVSLRGHADSIGTYKGNWVLSQKRADEVKAYLVNKGVDGNKIIVTPFGSTIPLVSNKTAEGRQKNRRVEIMLKSVEN